MKTLILSVLFSVLLSYPVVSAAVIDTPDIGKGTLIDLQLFKVPFGANPPSNAASDKNEGETKDDGKKEKELDKKVDDAIKKALEEK